MTDKRDRFLIGHFARIMGSNADTLRYYEKCGLLPARRDEINRYRYYTLEDYARMNMIQALRSLGFSINSIKQNKCRIGTPQFEQQISGLIDKLDDEARYLEYKRAMLEAYSRVTKYLANPDQGDFIEDGPREFLFFEELNRSVLLSESFSRDSMVQNLRSLMPATFPACVFSAEHVVKTPKEGLRKSYGYAIDALKAGDMVINQSFQRITFDSCLHVYVRDYRTQEKGMQLDMFIKPMARLAERGYEAYGQVMGCLLPMNLSDDHTIVDCFIPIRKLQC